MWTSRNTPTCPPCCSSRSSTSSRTTSGSRSKAGATPTRPAPKSPRQWRLTKNKLTHPLKTGHKPVFLCLQNAEAIRCPTSVGGETPTQVLQPEAGCYSCPTGSPPLPPPPSTLGTPPPQHHSFTLP